MSRGRQFETEGPQTAVYKFMLALTATLFFCSAYGAAEATSTNSGWVAIVHVGTIP